MQDVCGRGVLNVEKEGRESRCLFLSINRRLFSNPSLREEAANRYHQDSGITEILFLERKRSILLVWSSATSA